MLINGLGAISTAVVAVIFAVTKFRDGAWVIIILVPVLVTIFFQIHHHYKHLANQLSLDKFPTRKNFSHNRVIIPVSGVHNGTLAGLHFAHTLSDDVTAVHISIDPIETAKVRAKWENWGDGYRLVVLDSPYRLLLEPLLEYIDKISLIQAPNEIITIVVPQFVPKHWWANFLHMRTAESLHKALLHRKNIVITEVPYQID